MLDQMPYCMHCNQPVTESKCVPVVLFKTANVCVKGEKYAVSYCIVGQEAMLIGN